MSLCYGLQKWTMVTFALVAISLTVGLVLMQSVHGLNATEQLGLKIAENAMEIQQMTNRLDSVIAQCKDDMYRKNLEHLDNCMNYINKYHAMMKQFENATRSDAVTILGSGE